MPNGWPEPVAKLKEKELTEAEKNEKEEPATLDSFLDSIINN